ncbi:TOMM precursor leader peptide-binding protein [Streptomyces goshikiensis]|uniref:TOMM precursor leader peptide-binding protein n=1 Tax=Streptomyces goshikiensis TaxID=1942 RepID=UPI0036602765
MTAAPADSAALLGFAPHLSVETVPGEAVYLISDQRVTALHGEQIARLTPLLDGTRRLEELLTESAAALAPEQTRGLLGRLSRAGLLAERPAGAVSTRAAAEYAYWAEAGLDGAPAARRLADASVHITAVGPAAAGPSAGSASGASAAGSNAAGSAALRAAAEATGLRVVPEHLADTADLTVVLCDSYLNPALRALDAGHRAAGRPWLPVRAEGTSTWIGPFMGARAEADEEDGAGGEDGAEGTARPCWSCMAVQLWRSRQAEAHVQRALGRSGPLPRPARALPAGLLASLHLAVLEATQWLAGHRHSGQRDLRILDGLTLTGDRHPVRRRPQCADCGDPGLVEARVSAPLVLAPRAKVPDPDGGGHRALTPSAFLDRYGHLVDPVTGLVKEVRRDPRGPAFLNSFHAGHNPAAGAAGLASLRSGLRSTSSGKGATALQARVGALAEAVERHSGHLQGDEPLRLARYRDLGPDAVHPDAVQLFDPRQFAGRETWNRSHNSFQHVPEPFDEDAPVEWTPVWSLTAGRHRLLPTALLYYNGAGLTGRRYAIAHSNGTAAGGSPEDAVLQGFLELVERDAVAVWWYNRTRRPGIDLVAHEDPWITELQSVHRSLRREVWALDLTSDLGVPVVAALSRRVDKPAEDIVLGFGAHFDPRIALRRALAEVNQLLPPVLDARADGTGYQITDQQTLSWMRTATTAGQPHLRPDSGRRPVGPGQHPYTARTDLRADVAAAEEIVRRAGMELLVLDQTRPDVGLPVVRVIVPGLRPHWARFAPGRLFDVPVRLGERTTPLPYEDLNPVPLFL